MTVSIMTESLRRKWPPLRIISYSISKAKGIAIIQWGNHCEFYGLNFGYFTCKVGMFLIIRVEFLLVFNPISLW